ncbi:MAG: hypothetical protein GY927_14685 [bacterium]|nr:hypothetical protein [bacterium]
MALINEAASLGDLEAQFVYGNYGGPQNETGLDRSNNDTIDAYKFLSIVVNKGHRLALATLDDEIGALTGNVLGTP